MATARRFTLEEANAALSELRERLERIRTLREQVIATAEEISERASRNGGATTPARSEEAADQMRAEIEAIAAAGIILRDAETGLVDFPSERDGEEILLCWRLGEDDVGFWHPTDSGFSGRTPL